MSQDHTRTIQLTRKDSRKQSFPAVLATETPVFREGSYWEVLDMSRVDLARAPLPLIESHNDRQLNIGIVDGARVDGKKLRGDIRMGNTARARELSDDMAAGIVRSISIGYGIFDPVESGERDGYPVYRFAFAPYEVSLVAAPADTEAGLYRSKEHNTMDKQQKTGEVDFADQGRTAEQTRIDAISQAAERFKVQALGLTAIRDGWTLQEFNTRALADVQKRDNDAVSYHTDTRSHQPRQETFAGMPCDNSSYGRAMEQYSITRLIRGLSDPKLLQHCGLELEISQDMQRAFGKDSSGVSVPYEALAVRATTYGGDGSNIVATQLQSGSFIDVLRARSLVMSLGPTSLAGLVGNVDIPRKSGSTSAYWIAGDGADSLTSSDMTLGKIPMSPKTVGGLSGFSHRMLRQSTPDIENLIKMDLADMIASQIDLKAINGDGTGNTPVGILSQTGIGSATYALGGSPNRGNVIALESTIADANADRGRLVYLTTPALSGALKQVDVGTDTGVFVWEGNNAEGRMNGYAAFATANVPAGHIILGNFADLIVGFWGGIDLDVDPYGSNFDKGSVSVRILADLDFAVRHPESFAEIHEAAA